jgi:hypothetical protein
MPIKGLRRNDAAMKNKCRYNNKLINHKPFNLVPPPTYPYHQD